ncbi:MAG: ParB/RepB/Spo0J family partition protein [Pyrinomonadaceae bacterium]
MSRKALGRGIGALISNDDSVTGVANDNRSFFELDIDLISPNANQPRTKFPEAELEELTQSIRANGIVQPIVVRKIGKQYEIVAGERRWRAAQRAELTKIPSVVREVSDDKLLELALIENIQRQELNPIEESKAYQKLLEAHGLTQEEVATRVGKTRTFIANYLRLLKLPEQVTDLVESSKLSVGHARALLALEEKSAQNELAKEIISKSLSVRETERTVNKILKRGKVAKQTESGSNNAVPKDPNVKRAESKLRRLYATQVRISTPGKGKSGTIELEFYGDADLDRIYKLLMRN